MILTTEDLFDHDRCPRFRQWNTQYSPLRVSFHFALQSALNVAIAANDPIRASERIMALAANPGIDYSGSNLYSAVVHHSHLAELLATYVLTVESTPLQPIPAAWGEFQPQSFLMRDGRLRRIILCDRWTPDREQMERFSWRTVADTSITGRPMTLTAILIGSLRDGFRPSSWTQAYIHPQSGVPRISKRHGEFSDAWKKVYRESSAKSATEWLGMMQSDKAFDGNVISVVEDAAKNRDEILNEMAQMAREMALPRSRQTRSACYRFTPCPFLPACSTGASPSRRGWTEKPIPPSLPVLNSS